MKYSEIAAEYDTDGIDVYFLNNLSCEKKGTNVNLKVGFPSYRSPILTDPFCQSTHAIAALFDAIQPERGTPIGRRLQALTMPYLASIRSAHKNRKPLPRPRNYIIITDGDATDRYILEQHLTNVADTLDELDCPECQIGFQFVQIGNDPGATEFLKKLDDDIVSLKRDIVDTVKASRGVAFGESDDMLVKKILLGGINRKWDYQRAAK